MPDPINHLAIAPEDLSGAVGEAMFAGTLHGTLRSKLTGIHVTLRLHAKAKVAGRWRETPWSLCTHVFIDAGSGWDKVGTYYPAGHHAGWLYPDGNSDPARVWAAKCVLQIAADLRDAETDQYILDMATHCLRCGRELTEPDSIEAGLGPDCRAYVRQEYGRSHQRRSPHPRFEEQMHRAAAADAQQLGLPFDVKPGETAAEFVARMEAMR